MSLAASESAPESSDATFETFDNFDEISDEVDAAEDDWSKPEPESEKVSEDLKVIKDSQADSEGKVIKEDKKSEKEEEDDSEDGEEEESEEQNEESEEEKPEEKELEEVEDTEKKDTKKLRMRMGNELFNVDSDASFKVKVDGESVDVPLQELINNYSGKTAWDKKFTDLGKEKKAFESEVSNFKSKISEIDNILIKAISPLKQKDGNPMDSLLYLVELAGEDPYNAYRRIMEANLEELGMLYDMPEIERELHFRNKKDELHGKVAKKRYEEAQKEQVFNQTVQKVDSLRQAFNVTEDQYVEASEELEEIFENSKLDVNNITHETIVDYASLKPHIAVVTELIEPYEDNISEGKYGDVVAELSRYLRDGKADKDTIQQILKRNFSVEEDVKELNTKVYSKGQKAPVKKTLKQETSKFESFDDWEED
jgi:hypothetical protein